MIDAASGHRRNLIRRPDVVLRGERREIHLARKAHLDARDPIPIGERRSSAHA
jgi:hypothetical protein